MSDEELKAFDDWRFRCRIATRSDAIRRLARIGLLADDEATKNLSYLLDPTDLPADPFVGPIDPSDPEFQTNAEKRVREINDRFYEIGLNQLILYKGIDALRAGKSTEEAIVQATKVMDEIRQAHEAKQKKRNARKLKSNK